MNQDQLKNGHIRIYTLNFRYKNSSMMLHVIVHQVVIFNTNTPAEPYSGIEAESVEIN